MFVFEKDVKYGNVLVEKSFEFAKRIVKFYSISIKDNYQFSPLYKQILRSGTSIGANIHEAQSAYTKNDFINKLGIALKESRETDYWIKLLRESDLLSEKQFTSLLNDCIELTKLLTSIIKSAKEKL